MSPGGGWRYKTKKKSVSNKKRTLYVLLSLSSVCTGFLFILPVKVYHTDNSYNARGYGYNNCSHLYSLSSFLFLTSSKPAKRVIPLATCPIPFSLCKDMKKISKYTNSFEYFITLNALQSF